jgi:hypothetical protein
MPESTAGRDWTIVLLLTALALTLVVLTQTLARHATAYMAAPREVSTFLDAVDFSIQENESYDRDVARVPLLEDKIRLGRVLREIQKSGDDLREDLNALLMDERGTTLRTGARLLWASKRVQLEDRMRRLDMLRLRFLVLYMGIVKAVPATSGAGAGAVSEKTPAPVTPHQTRQMQQQENGVSNKEPVTPQRMVQRSMTEGAVKKAPLRRLTTTAIGHKNDTDPPHKKGWFGVIQELQRSPKLLQRHATIETAMAKSATP